MRTNRWSALLLIACTAGCPGDSAKPPVSAEKPKVEADLAFTNLSKKAYAKLDIKTQRLALEVVSERLALTGWIMARPGHEVTMTAPSAGYVHFRKSAPIPGVTVAIGQWLLDLEPVLTPVEKIQVASLERSIKSDLIKAETTLKTADSEYKRIKNLHEQKLKSDQELELAKKAYDHAYEERKAAEDKLLFFKNESIPLNSPQAGTILQLHVGNGQYVPASAPLVTIIDLDPVWVRVPVPEFDLPMVDASAIVDVTLKNANHGREVPPKAGKPDSTEKNPNAPVSFKAKPAGRVAQIDPLKRTADLWYELEKTHEARFIKDQMVTVTIGVGKKEKAPVVANSAVIYDAHGRAWVYLERPEKDGKHQFERRPVEVVAAVGDGLLVRSALSEGDLVVTRGAALLFSRDFHKTPIKIDGEDE